MPSSAHARDNGQVLAAAGTLLEDQLTCLSSPKPALVIRSMIHNGLVEKTKYGVDGSPVLRAKKMITVFGARLLYVTGWEREGDRVRAPFWRGPGMSPPLFLSVVLDAAPANIPYKPHMVRGSDGLAIGSFSLGRGHQRTL